MKFTSIIVTATVCLLWASFAAPGFAQNSETIDLSGNWLTLPGDDVQRGTVNAKENTWKTTTLPGSTPSDGFVWYRKHFTVPADWATDPIVQQEHEIVLHIGNFQGALDVYLNGYHVQEFGTLPTDSKGSGFSPGTPASSDVLRVIATQATVGGKSVTLFNYGADNVIAFRVYAPVAGDGFTGGKLLFEKLGFDYFYPYTRTLSASDGLYDSQHPIMFDVALGNRTATGIKDTLNISALTDEGVVPMGFTPSSGPVSVDSKTIEKITPTIEFGDPGFYTITVGVNADGKQLPDDSFVVGFNSLEIEPTDKAPVNFHSYWASVVQDASAPTTVSSSGGAAGSNFNFTGIDGKPVSGWLTLPSNASGKVPLIVEFPPYNSDFTGPDASLQDKGVATLVVNVDESFVGADSQPITDGLDDSATYAYRTIVGNALKAVMALPGSKIDLQNVGLAGVDQGGAIAFLVAALDSPAVKAMFIADPLFALPAHSVKAASSGPYLQLRDYVATHETALKNLSYFDIANFAADVKAPVYLQVGLLDNVTPPYGIFAAANEIKSPITSATDPNAGHASPTDLAGGLSWLAAHL